MIPLETLPDAARRAFEGLQSDNLRLQAEQVRLQQIIALKDEQIRLLNFRFFGPKSEKLSPAQMSLLQTEISLTLGEVEQETEQPAAEKSAPVP